jgi:hypothetical protein
MKDMKGSAESRAIGDRELAILERGNTNSKIAKIEAMGKAPTKFWYKRNVPMQPDPSGHTIQDCK